MDDLSCGIRMWAQVWSFFHFVTKHAFDRQTDKQKDGQKGLGNTGRCITCSCMVKTTYQKFWRHLTLTF